MSAINVVVDGAGAFLVTDGAYYDVEQKVRCYGAKVMTLPHIPAAIATAGPAGMVHLYGDLLYHTATSLDELMESSAIAGVAANASTYDVRVIIAGICSNGQAAAWMFDGERFERIADGSIYMSPAVDGWNTAWEGLAGFDAAMVELVSRQRGIGPVGGFVARTSVVSSGISQRILHRWPDRVGDAIGPPPTLFEPAGPLADAEATIGVGRAGQTGRRREVRAGGSGDQISSVDDRVAL